MLLSLLSHNTYQGSSSKHLPYTLVVDWSQFILLDLFGFLDLDLGVNLANKRIHTPHESVVDML